MEDPQRTERLLWLLDHGTRAERIEARSQLGRIFERRGMWDYAAECYEGNVRAGVRDWSLFARLGMVYLRDRRWRDTLGLLAYLLDLCISAELAVLRSAWTGRQTARRAPIRIEGNRAALLLAAIAVVLAAWAAFRPSPQPQQVTTVVRQPVYSPQQQQSAPRPSLASEWVQEQQRRDEQNRINARQQQLESDVKNLQAEVDQERSRRFWESIFPTQPQPQPSWGEFSSRCTRYFGC